MHDTSPLLVYKFATLLLQVAAAPQTLHAVGALFNELGVAEVLHPIFRAGQPQWVRQLAQEVCGYADSSKVPLISQIG